MNILRKNCINLKNTTSNNIFSNVLIRTATAYKSALSLENLYPESSLKLTTPSKPHINEKSKFDGFIPIDQLEITYSRSSGPGGQNVNKVNTKVDVRFHLQSAKWLSDDIKSKLNQKTKITKEGHLIFRSDLTRFQQLNLADCLEKIRTSIRNVLVETAVPSPETEERIRQRFLRANQERLAIKRQHSQTKRERQTPTEL